MYPLKYHSNLSIEKWSRYSKGQQLIMIANELNRARVWLEKNQPEESEFCYERAFELTDLILEDKKWSNSLKELFRFREVLGELYIVKNITMNNLIQSTLIALSTESYNLLHG